MQDSKGKKLLIVNYSMDLCSPVFAHQPEIVDALAKKFTTISVITSSKQNSPTEKNVKILQGWKISQFRVINLLALLRIFIHEIIQNRPFAIFFHMTDVHAAFLAPIARVFGIPVVMWYAHAHKSRYLSIASPFVNSFVSSTEGSIPLRSRKIILIGQSIKAERFPFVERDKYELKNFVHIGRTDESKNIALLAQTIEKFCTIEPNATLTLIGSRLAKNRSQDVLNLNQLSSPSLNFINPIERSDISKTLAKFDVFIHAFQGSLDKAVLEATFTGIPVVSSNMEYIAEFGCWCNHFPKCEFSLYSDLIHLKNLNSDQISKILKYRAMVAKKNHEFHSWVNRLSAVLLQED